MELGIVWTWFAKGASNQLLASIDSVLVLKSIKCPVLCYTVVFFPFLLA